MPAVVDAAAGRTGRDGGPTACGAAHARTISYSTLVLLLVVGTRLDLNLLVPFTRTFLGTVLKY